MTTDPFRVERHQSGCGRPSVHTFQTAGRALAHVRSQIATLPPDGTRAFTVHEREDLRLHVFASHGRWADRGAWA